MVGRKPTARRGSSRRAPRWDDPPRRGNPLGLVLAAAAAIGLVYTACSPKGTGSSGPPPSAPLAVEAPAARPVVPRGRYEAPRTARVAETPERTAVGEAPRASERDRPATLPGAPKPGPGLAVESDSEDVVVAPDPAEGLDASEVPVTPVERDPAPTPPAPPAQPMKPVKPINPAIQSPVKAAPKAVARPRAVRGEFAHNPRATGEVALTFDGCYEDAPLPKILAALGQRGYRATFFLCGMFADRYPSSVKRIADSGMELGNHSWSHPAFTKLSDADIASQLSRTNDRIRKLTGKSPTLFRPPFGARDDRVRRLVAEEGYETIYWALDSWDAVRKGITAREVSQRVLSRVQPGDVVLMHIGSKATADALPAILKGLDERGLRVVPVSELMAR